MYMDILYILYICMYVYILWMCGLWVLCMGSLCREPNLYADKVQAREYVNLHTIISLNICVQGLHFYPEDELFPIKSDLNVLNT